MNSLITDFLIISAWIIIGIIFYDIIMMGVVIRIVMIETWIKTITKIDMIQ